MEPSRGLAVLIRTFFQKPTTAARLTAEAAQDTIMQTHSRSKADKSLPRPAPRRPEPRAISSWKPQDVGLTRQELRDIVLDVIG